ncbi:MAG: hypothetical protein EKK41_27825 [Hyphomicrobiales bacterium]|nr:MAG: hypothetical protein EKK41_27825 [Hyphomicrobiales bacterium]
MKAIANITRSKGDPKIIATGPSSLSNMDRLGRNLGWFSIGLGMMELMSPGRVGAALGMRRHAPMIKAFGAREIASGVMTLSTEKKAGLWSRVVGDMLDIATLMPGLSRANPKRGNVKLALAAVLGVTALDVMAAKAVTAQNSRSVGTKRTYADRSGLPKRKASALSSTMPRSGDVSVQAATRL